MRPTLLVRRFVLVAFACVATFAAAQSPPQTEDPRTMSEAARKVYAQTLREARDLIDRKQYKAISDGRDAAAASVKDFLAKAVASSASVTQQMKKAKAA